MASLILVAQKAFSLLFSLFFLFLTFLSLRYFASTYRTENSHGTGCTLAAYIAAELAKGASVPTAVDAAHRYVWRALERSVGLPLGSGPQRPLNHSFRVSDWRTYLEKQAAVASERAKAVEATTGLPGTPHFTPLKRLPNPIDLKLYAVTDPGMISASGFSVGQAITAALEGGATVIQLREKKCDGGEFMTRAKEALACCRAARVPLIINDRVDVALAVGAEGVHVGQDDLPAEAVRKIIGPDMILGISVKTVEEAQAAEAAGADYLGAGAIYSTSTKDSSVIGVESFRKVCSAVNIPVVAIGGVGKGTAAEVAEAGAAGIAVVSAIFAAEDMRRATAELREEVESAFH